MPRKSTAEALLTRDSIVLRAVDVASIEGLEGVTIGRLAGDLSMSKAGVIGHFGTKEALQLAVLENAIERFTRQIWGRIEPLPEGMPRLRALTDVWIDYIVGEEFPGGCFLTSASFEFDDRPGPVRDRIAEAWTLWDRVVTREARIAVAAGDLPADADPAQISFELEGVALATGQTLRLHRDGRAAERGRRAMQRVLGL